MSGEYYGSLRSLEPDGVFSPITLLFILRTSELKLSMFSSTVSRDLTFSIKFDTDSNFLMKTKAASAENESCFETARS